MDWEKKAWKRIDGELYLVRYTNPYDLSEFEAVEPLKIVYSESGESHGSGTARYRWVSKLTEEEQSLVKGGHIVVIDKGVSIHAPQPIQYVIWSSRGGYDHRVPPEEVLVECLRAAGYTE